jgi:hypothetical protein
MTGLYLPLARATRWPPDRRVAAATTTRSGRRSTKFVPGRMVVDMLDLVVCLEAHRWFYMHGRPKHPGFIRSMQFNALAWFVRQRRLRLADFNPDHPDNQEGAQR